MGDVRAMPGVYCPETMCSVAVNDVLAAAEDAGLLDIVIIGRQINGEVFTRMRRIWRTDDMGERVLVDRVKRTRAWYWMSGAGGCYFSVWYGSKMLELKPGMTAIQVNKREELPDAIRSVMEAVKQGELDIQIEDVAEQGTAELRLRAPLKPVKKVG